MKKLTISVILGSMLFGGSVMSSENYKPREFWDNTEVVKSTLEKAYNIAQARMRRVLNRCTSDRARSWAYSIANGIYSSITDSIEQNCLEALSMDEFLTSLDLYAPNGEWIPMEKIWSFLDHVGNILDRKLY